MSRSYATTLDVIIEGIKCDAHYRPGTRICTPGPIYRPPKNASAMCKYRNTIVTLVRQPRRPIPKTHRWIYSHRQPAIRMVDVLSQRLNVRQSSSGVLQASLVFRNPGQRLLEPAALSLTGFAERFGVRQVGNVKQTFAKWVQAK